MNTRLLTLTLAGLAALALVSSNLHAQDGMATKNGIVMKGCCSPQGPQKKAAPVAASQTKAAQKVTITVANGSYSPASITVKAGKPVELTFLKGKNIGCGDTVVFPGLKITKELKAPKTVIMFTPKKAGKLAFTCSMGMYEGSVTVK